MNDDELPAGWAWSTVGEVGLVQLGRQRSPKNHVGDNMRPYLRVANVFEDRIDTSDVMSMNFTPDEYPRYRLEVGDILLNEGQSPELLGRPAMYRGDPPDICFTNSLIRFRAHGGIEPSWALLVFRHHMHSLRFMRESQITTNIAHLSAGRLKPVEFPVPPTAEQRRIVGAADAAFSKLDAGLAYLDTAAQRLDVLERRIRERILEGPWEWTTLGALLSGIEAGKSFKTRGLSAGFDEWGVIKVSAMTYGSFRPEENKALPPGTFVNPAWMIRKGDILFSRANTSDYVGASVLVDIDPGRLILSDKSLRLVPKLEVDVRWLQLALAAPGTRSQLSALATGVKDSMRNISQEKLKSVRLPRPSLGDQLRAVAAAEQQLAGVATLRLELRRCVRRSLALRRAVLQSAFSGRLVTQDPTDEPGEKLLQRLSVLEPLIRLRGRRDADIGVFA